MPLPAPLILPMAHASRSFRFALPALLAWVVLAAASCAPPALAHRPPESPAKLTYIREFPKSNPEYFAITITQAGEASYATAPDDSQPVIFRLPEALVKQFFEAAARLNNFQGADLELKVDRKVAFMGKKTLVYESGSTRNQASFNYTQNADARQFAEAFEKIGATERHLLELERVVRFDRLGVYSELLQIESEMNARDSVEPSQFVPWLEKISADSRFMHVAQERARTLLDLIHSGKYRPNIDLAPQGRK